jgi:CRISPR-associated endonuclease/helicase Cas3
MSDNLPSLGLSDFGTFFETVHGQAPFPWQSRLLAEIQETGSWPSLLDLPTGVGKTAALDIALFHLALEAGRPARRAALRIIFTVDRRTIVDQATTRALKLAKALESPTHPILVAMKTRLASLSRSGEPLSVATLRGGMPRSDAWAKSPDRPVIAISTVDQVGSRLLFRGYGLSDAMRPIHAGLLGEDVLYLLDEVHLSEPFRQTLAAIGGRYRTWSESPTGRPFGVVEMSATPSRERPERTFGLDPSDRTHPVLAQRLAAQKPTKLIKDLRDRDFIETSVGSVKTLLDEGRRTLAVVVNRVRTARDACTALTEAVGKRAQVHLLTGRMRPLDRDDLERTLTPRIGAGRRSADDEHPIVIVATQCIEAGADFDFDGLVTECASLDALRQRFGRLNRLGKAAHCQGVILGRSGDLRSDPVYGDALHHTLTWLSSQTALDFGLERLQMPDRETLATLVAPGANAPILLPAHLDAWVQTAPIPDPDPDISLWLHGPERGSPEVTLVWRADLIPEMLEGDHQRLLESLLEALPPSPPEALSVPLAAVRRWLLGLPEPVIADVEGAVEDTAEVRAVETRAWKAIAWRADGVEVVDGRSLRPHDTLIVPALYGGLTRGNWSPDASDGDPVIDRAEEAILRQRGRVVLRLHPDVIGPSSPMPPRPDSEREREEDRMLVNDWLASVEGLPPRYSRILELLRNEPPRRRRLASLGTENITFDRSRFSPFFVVSGRRIFEGEDLVTTESEEGSFTGTEVSLEAHLEGVADFVTGFARALGLPGELASDLTLAASWHDAGKADPRFQRLLHGGDAFRAEVAPHLIAKSAMPSSDAQARKRAQTLSGYPRGARHELLSVAMLDQCDAVRAMSHDWDLVLHLVGSHHGHCRPLAPVAPDESPLEIAFERDGLTLSSRSDHGLERLDSGVGDRFWRLVRRYGWWGLAYLEAILRLGDHRRSESEQRGGVT